MNKLRRSSEFSRFGRKGGEIMNKNPNNIVKDELYSKLDWNKATALFQEKYVYSTAHSGKFPSTKDLLRMLGAAGVVGMTFAFPPTIAAVAPLIVGKQKYDNWRTKKILLQLERQKYVSPVYHKDGSVTVTITRKGLAHALTYQLDTMTLKPVKWDGKWRVVLFDVPEKQRKLRNLFRTRLKQLSLYQFQKSIFVSPYPCFNEVEFLRALYGVQFNVQYMLAEKIENDEVLRNYFELPQD